MTDFETHPIGTQKELDQLRKDQKKMQDFITISVDNSPIRKIDFENTRDALDYFNHFNRPLSHQFKIMCHIKQFGETKIHAVKELKTNINRSFESEKSSDYVPKSFDIFKHHVFCDRKLVAKFETEKYALEFVKVMQNLGVDTEYVHA